MTPEERARRFAAQAEAELDALPRVQKDVLAEIVRQLQAAEQHIVDTLRSNPGDSAARRLRALKLEVEHALDDFCSAATTASTQGVEAAWAQGIRSITEPFAVAGIVLAPRIDAGALLASRQFLTHRIEDISRATVNRLNGSLMRNLIGDVPLSDTITHVQRILGGSPRSRAMTLAYTELGRAHSISQGQSLQQAGQIVPGVRKRWLKSGKTHPRMTHVAANNQVRRYDESYLVDGEHLRFPRDPNGSAGNTINCGCHSIPVMDGSSFGASTVRINDDGDAWLERPDGQRVPLPK